MDLLIFNIVAQLVVRDASAHKNGRILENFQTASDPPPAALVSANYVALFFERC